jgi:GTP-binding protein TrmE N-terminus
VRYWSMRRYAGVAARFGRGYALNWPWSNSATRLRQLCPEYRFTRSFISCWIQSRSVTTSLTAGSSRSSLPRVIGSFDEDTIYALSTAPGRAGIAIVRISGPSCLEVRSHPRTHIKRIDSVLTFPRYTEICVLQNRSLTHDMPLFGRYSNLVQRHLKMYSTRTL